MYINGCHVNVLKSLTKTLMKVDDTIILLCNWWYLVLFIRWLIAYAVFLVDCGVKFLWWNDYKWIYYRPMPMKPYVTIFVNFTGTSAITLQLAGLPLSKKTSAVNFNKAFQLSLSFAVQLVHFIWYPYLVLHILLVRVGLYILILNKNSAIVSRDKEQMRRLQNHFQKNLDR